MRVGVLASVLLNRKGKQNGDTIVAEKRGKNPSGGLNEKGRKSYERQNPGSDLKAPVKRGTIQDEPAF